MRRAVIFNYDSLFIHGIERCIRRYNSLKPDKAFSIHMFKFEKCLSESLAGPADVIIHSGGDGTLIQEDVKDVPKLYICYSHEWKAKKEGGKVAKLEGFITGIQVIDVLEDHPILGKSGKMDIMKYHRLAVTEPPPSAKVLAESKARLADGKEIKIIEALSYQDGSISLQGHPEEGTAMHIIHNFFDNIKNRVKNETF